MQNPPVQGGQIESLEEAGSWGRVGVAKSAHPESAESGREAGPAQGGGASGSGRGSAAGWEEP
jgi:hypothetical protein